jgi:two-component system nitrogen regulation response regulator NtrX
MAVRAVKSGAFDFLEKPLSIDKVLTAARNAYALRALRRENTTLKQKDAKYSPLDRIIGSSPEMLKVKARITQAAPSEARILITGENGTGKDLAARAIHELSPRARGPFVEVNCAAIPDTLIESELFGHEKGAFTDAVKTRTGRFESASGGTLFLDEVGDMSLAAQSKVLRAIQEQKIERVGGEKTIDVDVRIVAATNKNLPAACAEGTFREDLFFRLNVIPLRLPPLRERKSDIPLLLYHFLEESNRQIEFSSDALSLLESYVWPGNIRELRNFAERVAVMFQGNAADKTAVEDFLNLSAYKPEARKAQPALPEAAELLEKGYNEARDAFEKRYLEYQLSKNNGVISRTAEAIGIYPSNLHAKLRKYGIKTHD